MWKCPKCKERIENSFDLCWSCGTAKDGTEDPSFRKEAEGIMSAADFEADRAERANENLVTIASYPYAPQAHFLCTHLDAAGIRAVVQDEHAVMANIFLSNAMGGVKVQVLARDVDRALQIAQGLDKKDMPKHHLAPGDDDRIQKPRGGR